MAEITVVRQPDIQVTEEERAIVRRVVFGAIDGLGERGRRQWRGLWNRMLRLEPGEMLDISTHQDRLDWYHRKHMALEQAVFEAQEHFEHFRTFRAWLKLGAGLVEWVPGPDGIQAVPLSIKYASMEQAEMEEFHANAVDFLRSERATSTLWPHLSSSMGATTIESILGAFNE